MAGSAGGVQVSGASGRSAAIGARKGSEHRWHGVARSLQPLRFLCCDFLAVSPQACTATERSKMTSNSTSKFILSGILSLSILMAACSSGPSRSASSGRAPAVSSYEDMGAAELAMEIGFLRKSFGFDFTDATPAQRNQLRYLCKLYAQKAGRRLDVVYEMYGAR